MCNLSEGIRQKYLAKGRAEERLKSIQSIMRTAKVTAEQAMDLLEVPEEVREELVRQLAQEQLSV